MFKVSKVSLLIQKRAFTLIELLIVIAIIALLTAIITANFSKPRSQARDAQRASDLSNLQLALALYFDRCREYPNALTTSTNNGCTSGVNLGTYISKIPKPPAGAGQNDYVYIKNHNTNPTNYVLMAILENENMSILSNGLNGTITLMSSETVNCRVDSTTNPKNYCIGPK